MEIEIEIDLNRDVNVYLVLGYSQKIIDFFSKWLNKKDNYLVVIDTKKALMLQGSRNCPNLILKETETLFEVTSALSEIAWKFIFLNIELIVLPSFEKKESDIASYVIQKWPEIKSGIHLSASSFADFKLHDLNSAMLNIRSKIKFSQLINLKGCFKNTPAIICGAGPSLDRSFLQMRDKALIFSGGSALNALKIVPHFIGLIDSETPDDFFQKTFDESILFFLLKAPNKILEKSFKKKFLCFDKENHLFFQWLVENIKLDFDLIEAGWSTVTFLTSLAVYFGCSPIIFNGVDLSFKSEKIYAEEVSETSYKKKNKQDFITARNAAGDEVKTQSDWFMSALFLQKLTASNQDINFYNLSQSGLSLGDSVKPFTIDKINGFPLINFTKKLDCLVKRCDLTFEDGLDLQILDLVDKELKIIQAELVELEKIFNGESSKLLNKKASWCRENVLMVLWDIFKFVFLRGESKDETYPFKEKAHQVLFFKDVLTQHKKQLERI